MTAIVKKSKPASAKAVASKSNSKSNKKGDGRKKPAAAMSMITSTDAMLAIPLGEIPATLPRVDLVKTFKYPVDEHVAEKGKYKGVKMRRLLLTTSDGVEHAVYPDTGVDLGDAFLHDPVQVWNAIAYSIDMKDKIVRGKRT